METVNICDTKPMTRDEVIKYMMDKYCIDISKNLRFVVKDYKNNPIAPERYCYKLYFTELGFRRKLALYPNTVGYQGF